MAQRCFSLLAFSGMGGHSADLRLERATGDAAAPVAASPRARAWLAALTVAILSLFGAIAMPAAASAAPLTHQVTVPAGAVTAWIDLEQAGMTAAQLTVEQREPSGTWTVVPMTQTTFGLHGSFAVAPGALELRLTPGANLSPDLTISFFDGASALVGGGAGTAQRVILQAGSGGGGGTGGGGTGGGGSGQPLGSTGAPATPLVLITVILLAAGAGLLAWRALSARRSAARLAADEADGRGVVGAEGRSDSDSGSGSDGGAVS